MYWIFFRISELVNNSGKAIMRFTSGGAQIIRVVTQLISIDAIYAG